MVDETVAVASEAFDTWRRVPSVERSQYLFDLKRELEARSEEIAQTFSREHGKTLGEARGEARTYRYQVDTGNIGVNVGVCAPMGFFHFGGRKESFFGDLHAQGEDAIDYYTEKTIQIERWHSSS